MALKKVISLMMTAAMALSLAAPLSAEELIDIDTENETVWEEETPLLEEAEDVYEEDSVELETEAVFADASEELSDVSTDELFAEDAYDEAWIEEVPEISEEAVLDTASQVYVDMNPAFKNNMEEEVPLVDGKAKLTVHARTTAADQNLTYTWFEQDLEWRGGSVDPEDLDQVIEIGDGDSHAQSIWVYEAGSYYCRIEDCNGEYAYASFEVYDTICPASNEDIFYLPDGESMTLKAPKILNASGTLTYSWENYSEGTQLSKDSTSNQVVIDQPGRYHCVIEETKNIYSSHSCYYYCTVVKIPNVKQLKELVQGTQTLEAQETRYFTPDQSGWWTVYFPAGNENYYDVTLFTLDNNYVDYYTSEWLGTGQDTYYFDRPLDLSGDIRLYKLTAGTTYVLKNRTNGYKTVELSAPNGSEYDQTYVTPKFQTYSPGNNRMKVAAENVSKIEWFRQGDMNTVLASGRELIAHKPGIYVCEVTYPCGLTLKYTFTVAQLKYQLSSTAPIREDTSHIELTFTNGDAGEDYNMFFPIEIEESGYYTLRVKSDYEAESYRDNNFYDIGLYYYDENADSGDMINVRGGDYDYDSDYKYGCSKLYLRAGAQYYLGFTECSTNQTTALEVPTVYLSREDVHDCSEYATEYDDRAASCTAPGRIGGTYCSQCKRQLTKPEVVRALGHEIYGRSCIIKIGDEYVFDDPTCTTDGHYDEYCVRCEKVIRSHLVDPALGHDWNEDGICWRCDAKKPTSGTNACTHKWSAWTVAKAATSKATGLKRHTCSLCGKSASETIPKATVKLNKKSVTVKRKKKVTLKIKSSVFGDSVKTWKTSNKKVAKVSKKGVVTGVKKGKATITLYMKSGAKVTCKVKVK